MLFFWWFTVLSVFGNPPMLSEIKSQIAWCIRIRLVVQPILDYSWIITAQHHELNWFTSIAHPMSIMLRIKQWQLLTKQIHINELKLQLTRDFSTMSPNEGRAKDSTAHPPRAAEKPETLETAPRMGQFSLGFVRRIPKNGSEHVTNNQ